MFSGVSARFEFSVCVFNNYCTFLTLVNANSLSTSNSSNLGHVSGAKGGARGSMQQFKLQCYHKRSLYKTESSFVILVPYSTKYEGHENNNVNYHFSP